MLNKLKKVDHAGSVPRFVASYLALQSSLPDKVEISNSILKGDDRSYVELISKERSPAERFDRRNILALDVLTKSDFLDLGIDRKAVAMESFHSSEVRCRLTNQRLLSRFNQRRVAGVKSGDLIWLIARKVDKILNRDESNEIDLLNELGSSCGFGPGSNVNVPRRRSLPGDKIGHLRPTTTKGCENLSAAILRWFDLWGVKAPESPKLDIVAGNRVTTVPKSYKTERTIAVEPLMNSFVQKGLGSMIRRRLRWSGLDLRVTPEIHSYYAFKGSLDGSVDTIDLKQASDCLAKELVTRVIPPNWLNLLDQARSERWIGAPSSVSYEKYSSMGNGYTFELESLIFYASMCVVRDLFGEKGDVVSVFGDDIILSSRLTQPGIEVLNHIGFEVNMEKSFFDGPGFRESCGSHFHLGVDVTPFYIRKDVRGDERLIWLANTLKRWCSRFLHSDGWGLDGDYHSLYQYLTTRISAYRRKPSIPHGYGDGALVRDLDECRPHRDKTLDGWRTSHFRRVYQERRGCADWPFFVANLLTMENRLSETDDQHLRNLRKKFSSFAETTGPYKLKLSKLLVTQWDNLGP